MAKKKSFALLSTEKYLEKVDWKDMSKKLQSLTAEAKKLAKQGKKKYDKLDTDKKNALVGAAAVLGAFVVTSLVAKAAKKKSSKGKK